MIIFAVVSIVGKMTTAKTKIIHHIGQTLGLPGKGNRWVYVAECFKWLHAILHHCMQYSIVIGAKDAWGASHLLKFHHHCAYTRCAARLLP